MINVSCRRTIKEKLEVKASYYIKKYGLIFRQQALENGYVRKNLDFDDCPAYHYAGRYGRGIVVFTYNPKSTKYCYINYFTVRV